MSKQTSDKALATKTVLGSLAVILISHFAWLSQFLTNIHNTFFAIVYTILWLSFAFATIKAYRAENVSVNDNSDDNATKWGVIIVAACFFLWLAGWASGLNGKKSMEQDIQKNKQEQTK